MNMIQTAALALAFSATVAAAAVDNRVSALQDRWAVINYELPEKQRGDAFEALAEQAEALVAAEPGNAEAHVWAGIIYSTWAGQSGPFGAMKRAKRAKSELEAALELDPDVLQGSAYTSLGALLHQIPSIMGGDDKKAEAYLRKGIDLNPDGIDANYFYAAFLVEKERIAEADTYLDQAAHAADRPGRELADRGRRQEVADLQSRVTQARH